MRISSVDLNNVTHRSIHGNMLCSQNMLVTSSSFINSTQLNDIILLLDIYTERIPPSLCLWGWLIGWIHLVDPWDLLTWHQGTEPFNLWGSQPLNCGWTSNISAIASNLHNKKLKTINEKLIQTFHQTLGVQIIHKP